MMIVRSTYDLSEGIGVSPWSWFADVPGARRANVHLAAEQKAWMEAVIANAHRVETIAPALAAGPQTIKVWRIDDNIALDSIRVEPAATKIGGS